MGPGPNGAPARLPPLRRGLHETQQQPPAGAARNRHLSGDGKPAIASGAGAAIDENRTVALRKSAGSFLSLPLRRGGPALVLDRPPVVERRQIARSSGAGEGRAVRAVSGRSSGRNGGSRFP